LSYHILGVISSALFLLTWFGLAKQILVIEQRRHDVANTLSSEQSFTRNLSINQFTTSYLAFYANFFFGIVLVTFNHYLVWTRLGALLLLLVILFRIWQDRKTLFSVSIFGVCSFLLLMAGVAATLRPLPKIAEYGTTGLMLLVTVLLVQGTVHQIWIVYKNKSAGDVSPALFKSILVKDVSTLAFGLTMPLAQAWPLLVLNGASVIVRGVLLAMLIKYRADSNNV
jgi:uncharacterized protein with PQ loop repeat